MEHYYVNDNAQANGDHEVHTASCTWLKAASNTTYLGWFGTCQEAVNAARMIWVQVNGCYYCAKPCHTQ